MKRKDFIRNTTLLATGSLLSSFQNAPLSDHQKTIKPPALKKGDKIVICSPAGAVWEKDRIAVFKSILESIGFDVILGKTLESNYGYFSGTDEMRANELNSFFKDTSIKGIFSMKGGWGCARLLDLLDYESIRENPKVLIGFSDITSLLIAITKKTGLVTFHGPVGNSGWNDFTKDVFHNIVQNTNPYSYPLYPEKEDKPQAMVSGIAKGELVGGNLSVLSGILGSEYVPNLKGKLLFIEEFKEEPYSIDRMLTQMKLNNVFNEVHGIILGKFSKCVPEEPEKSFTLQDVFEQHFKSLKIPVLNGALIGHIENKYTIPIGIHAEMDSASGTITLLESAVS